MRLKHLLAILLCLTIPAALVFGQAPAPSPAPTPVPEAAEDREEPLPPEKATTEEKLNVFKKVKGLENWDYTYDVSDLDRGMYNIIIQATDKAGNVFYSAPVNILIDPASDLPVVDLTNPVNDMRVGGSVLNIVGTCADDDAVDKVEVSLDDGEFQLAEGKDFWSFKLSTQGMSDGRHKITVRGLDVNGVAGLPVSRFFIIDTKKPLTTVTSFPNGVLLSGARDLEGTVEDLNDMAAFAYSRDGGKTWEPLGISYNKDERKYHFKFSIDTTRLTDGPNVFWFKGIDQAGSAGLSAFLFFVDNTKPVLSVLAPLPDAKVNGKFYVIGKVQDAVGVQSLTWQHREQSGDITLIPGNPYWYVEIDTTPYPATTQETVTFTVKDNVGNTVQVPVKIAIDQNQDKPVVTVTSPADKASTGDAVDVYGFVSDDDGAEAVVYTLDKKEAVSVPAREGFSFRLTGLDPGKHTLVVQALDKNKVAGDKKTIEFTVMGAASSIAIQSVSAKNQTRDFFPGVEIGRSDKAVLKGTISEFERFKQVTYSIEDLEKKNLSPRAGKDKYTRDFEIPLPDNVPYGIVRVTINAVDVFDRATEYKTFVHVTNYGKIFAEPGIYMADARLDQGTVAVSKEHPLEAFFVGDKVKTITTEPAIASIRGVEVDGRITIAPVGDLAVETAKIKITTENNEVFYSDEITFTGSEEYFSSPLRQVRIGVTDDSGTPSFYPGKVLSNPDGKTRIEGFCSSQATRVEVSFDNKNFRGAEYRRSQDQSSSFGLGLPRDLPFGYNEVYIRVVGDKNEQALYKTFFFLIDPAGRTTADDPGLYFSESAGAEIRLNSGSTFRGYMNGREIKSVTLKPATSYLKAGFDGMSLIIEPAGEGRTAPTTVEVTTVNNLSFTSPAFVFATDGQPPAVTVTAPEPGAWVNKTAVISGTTTDGTGIQSLEYRIGEENTWTKISFGSRRVEIKDRNGKPTGKFETVAGNEGAFSQTVDLSSAADGDIVFHVRALDQSGNETLLALPVKKDTQAPALSLITPEADAKVNGTFIVSGVTTDSGRTASVEFSADNKTFQPVQGTAVFTYTLDLAQYKTPPEKYYFRVTDAAGNTATATPDIAVDLAADKPRAEIQIPAKGETLRNDFLISGMVFDDDGVQAIYYRIDGKEFIKLEGGSSFSIPVSLADISDNEHKIEVQAEDTNGLKGDIASSTFFVSKAEPVSVMTAPAIDLTTRGQVTLKGTASDDNGIDSVELSFDNGNSWQTAVGRDAWTYAFDTNRLADGVHRLLIKARDKSGTEGLGATLMHVDNTAPRLSLDRPTEGESVSDTLVLDGRAFDNLVLNKLTVNIAPVNQTGGNTAGNEYELTTGGVFVRQIDMAKAKEGWYNIRVEARDKADNVTFLTRNIRVEQKKLTNRVEQAFPQDGDTLAGRFELCGRVVSELEVKSVTLSLDGKPQPLVLDANGYYNLSLGPDQLEAGAHELAVSAALADGSTVDSGKHRLTYTAKGPWVGITSLKTGDYVTKRPWLKGEAGYYLLPPAGQEDKAAMDDYRRELDQNRVVKVEISLDNGRSFETAGGAEAWNYRLQTQNIPDGTVRIMVRATTASGLTAVTKAMVNNDDRPPLVQTIQPEEGMRFNDKIQVLGIASDENGLAEVQINLRRGDKSGYVIPEFIQGMYFDFQGRTAFTGTFSWSAGFGLTFFDQNVKLQVQVGFEPESRFDGLLLGVKLLANIFKLPFESLFGPDLDFFSMSFSLGANFSYCTNSGDVIEFTSNGRVLAAAVAQWEFAKFTIKDWSAFNAYSLYAEFDVWFLSTDVPGAPVIEPKIMFGVRIGLF